jgi:hypothetical protein
MGNVKKLSERIVFFIVFAGIFPLAAYAQVPSYAQASGANNEETIRGRIASLSGQFNLAVRDDRGFIDSVQMHPGTIINPTGLSLAPGMSVTILGYSRGKVFAANEIDTAYMESYEYAPVYAYGADPYWDLNIGPLYGGWGYGGWGHGGGGWGHRGGWGHGGGGGHGGGFRR